jgi:hypothetical protein
MPLPIPQGIQNEQVRAELAYRYEEIIVFLNSSYNNTRVYPDVTPDKIRQMSDKLLRIFAHWIPIRWAADVHVVDNTDGVLKFIAATSR